MADEKIKKPADEIEAVKRLLILQLLHQGVKQGHIAAVLGIDEATMSRMLPKGLSAALKKER
ncbi:MAG TPA: hypothetical protein VG841_07060 [Caulobacterales bacterium]|nr:hypothetical protein [Caulobacterales bacterium]